MTGAPALMADTEITYRDALRQALQDAMRADDTVVVIGEEVGAYGGAYGVTRDLLAEFGVNRLIDTPISEPAARAGSLPAAPPRCGRPSPG